MLDVISGCEDLELLWGELWAIVRNQLFRYPVPSKYAHQLTNNSFTRGLGETQYFEPSWIVVIVLSFELTRICSEFLLRELRQRRCDEGFPVLAGSVFIAVWARWNCSLLHGLSLVNRWHPYTSLCICVGLDADGRSSPTAQSSSFVGSLFGFPFSPVHYAH